MILFAALLAGACVYFSLHSSGVALMRLRGASNPANEMHASKFEFPWNNKRPNSYVMSPTQASNILAQIRMCLAAGLSVPSSIHQVAALADAHPSIVWLDHEFERNPTCALNDFRHRELALASAAHLLERSFVTGSPLHGALGTLGDQLRKQVTQEVTRKVRTVGVKAVMPLGLCFLPAFVLLTVVPMAVGLFSTMSW